MLKQGDKSTYGKYNNDYPKNYLKRTAKLSKMISDVL